MKKKIIFAILMAFSAFSAQAQLDVILGQGNITLKSKYTKIKNSTTVPLGTTLKIGN